MSGPGCRDGHRIAEVVVDGVGRVDGELARHAEESYEPVVLVGFVAGRTNPRNGAAIG